MQHAVIGLEVFGTSGSLFVVSPDALDSIMREEGIRTAVRTGAEIVTV